MLFFLQTNENTLSLNLSKLSFFFVASLKIIPSMNKTINFLQKLKYSNATINIILNEIFILDEPLKKIKEDANFNFKDDLVLKNVSFNYKEKNIINNLSFTIKNSEVIMISGSSGVGKSTLVELICGLIKPKTGDIYLGDKNIYNGLNNWQQNIAYVPQKTSLIQDSIENNIAFSTIKKKIIPNKEKIKFLVELVELEKFVKSLDKKDQTTIGENFVNISGGQAQRLGIARALYQNPEIIIFDESFNSINREISVRILSNIKKNFKNIKIILISHDLYFKNLVNKIIELS
jgi:ATP-binding cassette subfamily C protein